MTRLRSLIKEALSTPPNKKDCECGCNDCEGKAPILTEGKIKHLISEGLIYHVENKIPLHESVYRIGSEKHFDLINEARTLWVRGLIDVSEDDQAILETHLGNFGMYEGEKVPLDMPMVENQLDQIDDRIFKDGWGFIKDYRREDESGPNKKIAFLAYNSEEEEELPPGQSLNVGSLDNLTPEIDQQLVNYIKLDYRPSATKITKDMIKRAGVDMVIVVNNKVNDNTIINEEEKDRFAGSDPKAGSTIQGTGFDWEKKEKYDPDAEQDDENVPNPVDDEGRPLGESLEERINSILEAKKKKKKKKKDPPIGKPKRGGPKAYYVYVRDPKTKRIKKVTFGSGGLRAKIRNPKARNAFAKRHRCSEKNDRTKASYWSCRLPRYAKQLGLGANMNTFW